MLWAWNFGQREEGVKPGRGSSHPAAGVDEHLEVDVTHCAFLATGIKHGAVKAGRRTKSEETFVVVVVFQACLRRQEYRRDSNEKKRDPFWGQETTVGRSRFSSGSSSKQVLQTLGDALLLQGVCVCVCNFGKSQLKKEMLKNLKRQGRERQGQELSSWVPPPPPLLPLHCVTSLFTPDGPHSSFL